MLKTFFVSFRIVPTVKNKQYELVAGAVANCWVRESDSQAAYAKAAFNVSKYDWRIEEVETYPVEVTRDQFLERDLGLEQFVQAQKEGIAIVYMAWGKRRNNERRTR